MPASLRPPVQSGSRKAGGGPRDWRSLFKKTIFLVLAISLAIHVLFLLAFGSVAIFKGSVPKLPFVSQEIAAEAVADTPPPPTDEPTPEEPTVTEDPFATEAPPEPAGEESATALDMLTVVGGANWAPAIPKNAAVSETGVIGGMGKGAGLGTGKGPGGPVSGKQLFGVSVQARKLGVIVSINQAAQNSGRLPGIFDEIFKEFPETYVFLTNGGGIMDWEAALRQFNERVSERKRKEKETGTRIPGPDKIEKPKVAKFNSGEALDWITIRGSTFSKDYPGLKVKYPDLFDELRKRPNVWFITGYKDANACHLAFDELIRRGVEAIYWYNSFDSPIEGQEAEKIAQQIAESKIEVLVQSQGSRVQGREWLEKVGAKFVK